MKIFTQCSVVSKRSVSQCCSTEQVERHRATLRFDTAEHCVNL